MNSIYSEKTFIYNFNLATSNLSIMINVKVCRQFILKNKLEFSSIIILINGSN